MSLSDLISLRNQLANEQLPRDPDTIVALRLPGKERYHLGRTHFGEICALITTERGRSGIDIRLKNVEVQQRIRCRVVAGGSGEQVIDGSLVVCRAELATLEDLFLRLIADAVDELGPKPSSEAVSSWLQRLANLLSRLEQDGRRRLQGLWAELLVLRDLGDPMLLIKRWHSDPCERFDFTASTFALEVKSCQDHDRVHEFSLEQLRPPNGLNVWVASVVVRPDPSGASVLDLLASVEAQLNDSGARSRLREIVLATGGSALEDDDHYRFDAATARASLRLIDVKAIPAIPGPIPPEIISASLQVRCKDVAKAGQSSDALQRLAEADNIS